jgi:MSHA biogenesis protein MshE
MNTVAKKIQLGAALVEQGYLKQEKLDEALQQQARSGRQLGRVLLDNRFVTEEQMGRTLAAQLDVPFVDLRRFDVAPETVRKLTEMQARRFRAIVLEDRDDSYLVGVVDPMDLRAQDELSALVRRPVDVAVITNEQLVLTIDRIYRKTELITEFAKEVERDIERDDRDTEVVDLNAMGASVAAEDAPVIRLLQTVLDDAAQIRASDIHVEPQENKLVIRFRIDGVLHTQAEMDSSIASALLVRLKLLASLDIAEKRLPQDGRMTVKSGAHRIDVRMSTVPTQYGESVVLRLLRQDTGPIDLEATGMPPEVFAKFCRVIAAPHGIVLVTGPTGSGKTTTLYGALQRLNEPAVKILTCEDPVEYRIGGLNQVQVNDKIDLTFARVLRSFLRQDPDIILVGEIRDEETAQIATRAAMTGHLVLSTLHTNDAVSTPSRLLDMGVPGYMIASTLLAVVSQRLVRLICRYCAKPHAPTTEEMAWVKHFHKGEIGQANFRRGKGCTRCNGVGYSGRVGIFEILEMDADLATAIHDGDPTEFERAARLSLGDATMERRAVELVLGGETTAAEAMTVVATDY